jgi:hypothetical protein
LFVLGQHNWAGGYSEIIEDNFSKLAKHLGLRGAIVSGHDGVKLSRELTDELSEAALSNKTIHDFIAKSESLGMSILLIGAHPSKLTDKDLFLCSPVEQIEKNFGSLDQFFSDLCEFSENRDISFLEKFEEKLQEDGSVSDFLELKPNMFGVGINLNAIIERWQR